MFRIYLHQQTPEVTEPITFSKEENTHPELLAFLKYVSSLSKIARGVSANQLEFKGKRFMRRCFAMIVKIDGKKYWKLIINPIRTHYIGQPVKLREGCITFPQMSMLVDRYEKIEVQYFDFQGNKHIENLEGEEAQTYQHELDHLNGVPEDMKPIITKSKNRNSICNCGSGKKVKHCRC